MSEIISRSFEIKGPSAGKFTIVETVAQTLVECSSYNDALRLHALLEKSDRIFPPKAARGEPIAEIPAFAPASVDGD